MFPNLVSNLPVPMPLKGKTRQPSLLLKSPIRIFTVAVFQQILLKKSGFQ